MNYKINFFSIFLVFIISSGILISGCGGGGNSVIPSDPIPTAPGPTNTPLSPTSTPLPTATLLPTTGPEENITGNVWSFNPGTSYIITAGDVVSLYNKSSVNTVYTITTDVAGSISESSVSEPGAYYRGGKNAEDFYDFLRAESEKLYETYGLPPVYSSSTLVANDVIGEKHNFWVLNSNRENVTITATLKAIGTYCYVYVDDASAITEADATEIATEWDNKTYPGVVSHFGSPTDIDGDSHIFLLLTPQINDDPADEANPSGLYGYFYSRDQYPGSTYSNGRDILYFNSAWYVGGDSWDREELLATLPHEFQHMVNFHYKGSSELTSFNEGLSMLSELLTGYGLPNGSGYAYNAVKLFELKPSDYSVTNWSSNAEGKGYGISFLFMYYIYERFGEGAIKNIVSGSTNTGILNIENVTGMDFDILYRNWVITNILDEAGTADPKFCYGGIDMAGNFGGKYYKGMSLPGIQKESLAAGSKVIKPWGVCYILCGGSGSFSVTGSNMGGLIFY